MDALETLLAAPVHQIALWKTIGAAGEPDACVTIYSATLPSLAETLRQRVCGDGRASVSFLSSHELDSRKHMDELLGRLLLAQLRALGLVTNRRPSNLLGAYDRWLEESLAKRQSARVTYTILRHAPPTFPCPMPPARVRMS